MFKRLIRQLHRWLGLTLGIVLAIMGVTGAIMAFEDPIMDGLSHGIVDVTPRPVPPLTPDALVAALIAQRPGAVPTLLEINPAAGQSARLTYRPAGESQTDRVYVDPYDGKILGKAHGEGFFATVRQLHRFILLPPVVGHQVTGAAAFCLIFFALSGLYLRWPRRLLDWKAWLKPELNRPGRALYYSLHQVTGTWLFLIYLVIALMGLTWAYDWYRSGLTWVMTGKTTDDARPVQDRSKDTMPGNAILSLDIAWRGFVDATPGGAAQVLITVPRKSGMPVLIRYLAANPPNDYALSALSVNPATGEIVKRTVYAEQPLGARIMTARLAVHRGSFFGLPGAILFMIAALTVPLFPITGYLLYRDRRNKKAVNARRRADAGMAA